MITSRNFGTIHAVTLFGTSTGYRKYSISPLKGRVLSGVIVVALEQAISAPFATRHLADQGATVIKVCSIILQIRLYL